MQINNNLLTIQKMLEGKKVLCVTSFFTKKGERSFMQRFSVGNFVNFLEHEGTILVTFNNSRCMDDLDSDRIIFPMEKINNTSLIVESFTEGLLYADRLKPCGKEIHIMVFD